MQTKPHAPPATSTSDFPLRRAVFLDRDGTLIEERHYLRDPAQVVLLSGAGPALQQLQQAGFLLFLVTNQSGVGRGLFTLADVDRIHDRINRELASFGVRFQRIYVAPEAPGQPVHGRKPSPRFVLDARDEFHLDLASSYFIGDKLIDLQTGWNAQLAASLLVRTGYGAELERSISAHEIDRAVVVADLPAASTWILRQPMPKRGA
jgi:D-glycero-D-manno-heptose 1,7-bisphosphate phosphatase